MSIPRRVVDIANERFRVRIDPLGAQLLAFDDRAAGPLLWDGDPAYWAGRAPILFPVIGLLNGGHYRYAGIRHPMPKHGFARDRLFTVEAADATSATFTLEADAATADFYPFAYRLGIGFRLDAHGLQVSATIENRDDAAPMPVSFGFHPALRWPLPYGGAREAHVVAFERSEPAPMRRLDAEGLLRPEPLPSPIVDTMLQPTDALFADDALIFDALASRRVVFGVPGRQRLAITFADFPILGVWTKPGAPFLCIEPWRGLPDPAGFSGDIAEKPGIMRLPPRSRKELVMSLSVTGA